MIRGFTASNQDVSFGGLYGVAPTFAIGVNAAERVEVLNGPNALLAGMQPTGSVGGSIDIIPKRAHNVPTTDLTATYVSETQFGGKMDIGRRFGANDESGIRINGAYSDGDTAVDHQTRTFGMAVAALDYQSDRAHVTLDLGYQGIETDNVNRATGDVTTRYDDSVITPAFGFVVEPMDNVTVYGNYIEGLQQGTIVGGSFANAGERLAPFVSEQYEAGIKVDWGRLPTTLSAFQITQPSGSAPSSTGVFGEGGEQRNRGIALSAFGEVTDDIRILGGVSLLDASLTKTANGINDGTRRAGSTGHL